MSDEQNKIEEIISKALSEKIGKKVIFAENFKIVNVPYAEGKSEIDIVLEPKDPTLPAVCMDLLYLIRCYGETLGITKESVMAEAKRDADYVR